MLSGRRKKGYADASAANALAQQAAGFNDTGVDAEEAAAIAAAAEPLTDDADPSEAEEEDEAETVAA